MKVEELYSYLYDKHGDKYGLMPPPTTDAEFKELIRKHFAPDYYSVNPISGEQFNTELLIRIVENWQPKIGRQNGKYNYSKKETTNILEKVKKILGGKE